jgi:hypothetical protein
LVLVDIDLAAGFAGDGAHGLLIAGHVIHADQSIKSEALRISSQSAVRVVSAREPSAMSLSDLYLTVFCMYWASASLMLRSSGIRSKGNAAGEPNHFLAAGHTSMHASQTAHCA